MFLYHQCPEHMQGNVLYPLNQLQNFFPEIALQARKKYQGREHLLERRIQLLNCLWNDVLHCAPVHPHLVYQAWQSLGKELGDTRWFKIPAAVLDQMPAVIYQSDGAVKQMDCTGYQELDGLPAVTWDWYRTLHRQNKQGAWFHGVPHVLLLGTLNTTGLEIISWKDPI
ncbi:hypothetical protein DC3_22010 [Deinococcus cellulosilyticus NBRC 106333 = KACC 11606]|uniref:Uncharacterized protein n=1 Tax=Deinococcus cellulosilyticus (strain DSM 18568 / NBRC 106333 / KACC 11606 / 5516J-15) TaxID=1223518 RepID=A0A511N2D0_DEIC1|nr:hypothetical protein DC3_22010 [Deinococcus cellulosilyticus NBRC 106333 = KACC 11606]